MSILSMKALEELDLYGNEVGEEKSYKWRISEKANLKRLDGLEVKGVVKAKFEVNAL
jgi:hypothetical protein